MDRLPPELLHLICAALDSKDVPSFRLINTKFAEVGLDYLFPDGQVDFYLCKRDLAMLRDVAGHSELNRHVKTLHYEGHTLEAEMMSFQAWRKSTHDFLNPRFRPKPVVQLKTRKDWRRHYNNYTEMMRDQVMILDQILDIAALVIVFTQCSNVRNVVFSNGYTFHNRARIHQPFEKALQNPQDYLEPSGVRLLTGVFFAASIAGLPLKSLTAGTISWRFFSATKEDSAADLFIDAFSSLTSLEIKMTTGMTEEDICGIEVTECRSHLEENDSICRVLRCIPDLESLKLSFDFRNESEERYWDEPSYAADLPLMVPENMTWPMLHTIELQCFEALQDQLLELLMRHKTTLKRVVLTDVLLNIKWINPAARSGESGSWLKVLPWIRNTLALEYGCVHGDIWSIGLETGDEEWHLPYEDLLDEEDVDMMRDMTDYLTRQSDVCPLSVDNMCFW